MEHKMKAIETVTNGFPYFHRKCSGIRFTSERFQSNITISSINKFNALLGRQMRLKILYTPAPFFNSFIRMQYNWHDGFLLCTRNWNNLLCKFLNTFCSPIQSKLIGIPQSAINSITPLPISISQLEPGWSKNILDGHGLTNCWHKVIEKNYFVRARHQQSLRNAKGVFGRKVWSKILE